MIVNDLDSLEAVGRYRDLRRAADHSRLVKQARDGAPPKGRRLRALLALARGRRQREQRRQMRQPVAKWRSA